MFWSPRLALRAFPVQRKALDKKAKDLGRDVRNAVYRDAGDAYRSVQTGLTQAEDAVKPLFGKVDVVKAARKISGPPVTGVVTKPRNPLHLDGIEGGSKRVSDAFMDKNSV